VNVHNFHAVPVYDINDATDPVTNVTHTNRVTDNIAHCEPHPVTNNVANPVVGTTDASNVMHSYFLAKNPLDRDF